MRSPQPPDICVAAIAGREMLAMARRLADNAATMLKSYLRGFAARVHAMRHRWYVRPFGDRLLDPKLWALQRRGVARGLATGLAICFLPLPIHIPLAIAIAIMARINLPATLLGICAVNPFTLVPAYYLAYRVGALVSGFDPQPFEFEMSWAWLEHGLGPLWKPFLLGCLICALLTGLAAWLLVDVLWQQRVRQQYRARGGSRGGNSVDSARN